VKYLALVLALVFTGVSADSIPAPVVDWMESNVVKVFSDGGTGSGFFIDVDKILTACHVVNGAQIVSVASSTDIRKRYSVVVEVCNTDIDLAILKLYDKIPESVRTTIAEVNPDRGTATYGSGYPMGLPLVIVEGHWQKPAPFAPGSYLSTAHVIPGDSGAPLVILKDGEVKVVGVRTGMLRKGRAPFITLFPSIGVVKGTEIINEFLKNNK